MNASSMIVSACNSSETRVPLLGSTAWFLQAADEKILPKLQETCAFDSGTNLASLAVEGYTQHPSDTGSTKEAH